MFDVIHTPRHLSLFPEHIIHPFLFPTVTAAAAASAAKLSVIRNIARAILLGKIRIIKYGMWHLRSGISRMTLPKVEPAYARSGQIYHCYRMWTSATSILEYILSFLEYCISLDIWRLYSFAISPEICWAHRSFRRSQHMHSSWVVNINIKWCDRCLTDVASWLTAYSVFSDCFCRISAAIAPWIESNLQGILPKMFFICFSFLYCTSFTFSYESHRTRVNWRTTERVRFYII